MAAIDQMIKSEEIDNLVDIDIELELEEWGRIALVAHKKNKTINETIIFLIEEYIMKETEGSNTSSD